MTALESNPQTTVLSHIDEVQHRHVEHGAGYLMRGPIIDVGVLRLRPGDTTDNHFHRNIEECFLVLEGIAEMWLDARHCISVEAGQFYTSAAGEMHYFRNEGSAIWRAMFIKASYDPSDTNPVAWQPGAPLPDIHHYDRGARQGEDSR